MSIIDFQARRGFYKAKINVVGAIIIWIGTLHECG